MKFKKNQDVALVASKNFDTAHKYNPRSHQRNACRSPCSESLGGPFLLAGTRLPSSATSVSQVAGASTSLDSEECYLFSERLSYVYFAEPRK